MWYGEPYFQSGTITGTFRHRDCRRFGSIGTFVNSICSACHSIPKIDSFRLKLQRRTDSNVHDSSTTNFTYLTRDQLLLKIKEAKEQVEYYWCRVFWLSGKLARVKQRVHSLRDKVKEFAKRGDINAIAYNIAKAYKDGKLKEKARLMNILYTMSKNLCKKKNGKRYSATTKDFYEVLLTMGVPRLCDFVAQNLDGPHVHSAMVWRNEHAITYVLGGHKQNIEAIAKLYRNAKDMMSISTTPVPYIKAEDETAIITRPDYKWDTD